jgi:tRNA (guanine-N7-)-methyltransferase
VAPRLLEIGFGSGSSLLAVAKSEPNKDFIGVETHKPGIGALLLGMQAEALTNIRLYHGDVVEILKKNIAAASLEGVQIFFPDPWPKRRHHPRRLIQSDFIALVVDKIKIGGTLHLATDWPDYARHMMHVISKEPRLFNAAGEHHYASRSLYRPLVTKFEQRALLEGRGIWELQFEKKHIATC